ncbi:hypothetical protein QUB05_04800 [Microcoleus sp. F10-C6]|uniref:hypothetical protein n=1 Tax=unclassified Microcoleus TaxID=2642155 RepID=UPI002FD48D5C
MEIRFRKKSELNSGASATSASNPASNPASNSTAELKQERESIFVKMTAKLRWERENIEPDLGALYPYYKHYCYIFLCDEEYVGQGYGNYRDDRMEEYDKVGRCLAKMWSNEEETEERKVNHYSRGCK